MLKLWFYRTLKDKRLTSQYFYVTTSRALSLKFEFEVGEYESTTRQLATQIRKVAQGFCDEVNKTSLNHYLTDKAEPLLIGYLASNVSIAVTHTKTKDVKISDLPKEVRLYVGINLRKQENNYVGLLYSPKTTASLVPIDIGCNFLTAAASKALYHINQKPPRIKYSTSELSNLYRSEVLSPFKPSLNYIPTEIFVRSL